MNLMKLFSKKSSAVCPPKEKLPRHIAFIMDGNGRWAKKRGLPRTAGHAAGTEALREIIRTCSNIGIESMSIYAFSTENWNRPVEEVAALMKLITRYFVSEIDELDAEHVKITILGDIGAFPDEQRTALQSAMDRTRDNTGLKLNIALNYGGRAEMERCVKSIAQKCVSGELSPEKITAEILSDEMYTAGQGDVDLLIRTGGDKRLSNFLLWQTWYAELIFNPVYWPDYNKERLFEDLNEFASRDRRFGRVKEK